MNEKNMEKRSINSNLLDKANSIMLKTIREDKTPEYILTHIKDYVFEAIKSSKDILDLQDYTIMLTDIVDNPNTSIEDLRKLANYPDEETVKQIVISFGKPEDYDSSYIYDLISLRIKAALASNPKINQDVLRDLKNYAVEGISNLKKADGAWRGYMHILLNVAKNQNTPADVLKDLANYPDEKTEKRVGELTLHDLSEVGDMQRVVAENKNTPSDALSAIKKQVMEDISKELSNIASKRDLRDNLIILKIIAQHQNTSIDDLKDLADLESVHPFGVSERYLEELYNMVTSIREGAKKNLTQKIEEISKFLRKDTTLQPALIG